MTLLWQCLCAALLPIGIRDIPNALEHYAQHLDCCDSKSRERQAAAFKRRIFDDSG